MKTFLNYWPWEPPALRLLVQVAVVLPAVLSLIAYPLGAPKAATVCWLVALAGLLFRLVYGAVGKRVSDLEVSLRSRLGPGTQALLVNGILQSPGVAYLSENEVTLAPIVGEQVVVDVASIESVQQTRFFNGKSVPGKMGLWLKIPGRKRLGLAIAHAHATPWLERFGL